MTIDLVRGRPYLALLAHGAGSSMQHATLDWLAGLLDEAGVDSVRFNFPYRNLGKSMPDKMPVLVDAFRDAAADVRRRYQPEVLIVGGHSMGGRAASMMESEGRAGDRLLLFGYPLHPPGQPEKLRDAHLPAIQTPTLQLNGTLDEFCTPDLMQAVLARLNPEVWRLHWIEGADHSYHVKKSSGRTRADVAAEIAAEVRSWLPIR